jgi:hypothetical protein
MANSQLSTKVSTGAKSCKPFLLKVMIYSPEPGYKFTLEVQKACDSQNNAIWKLLFDLYKKKDTDFIEILSVEFVAGDPNDIQNISAITSDGMKKAQVQAFREDVYPLIKPFGDSGQQPSSEDHKKIDSAMKQAINA